MKNRFEFIGRLTKDPELKTVGENVVANMTIAVQSKYKDKEGNKRTDFFNIQAWRKKGEIMAKYLSKGSLLWVDGEISNGKYKDKEGQDKYTVNFTVEDFGFLSPASQKTEQKPEKDFGGEEVSFKDDDLPF